MGFEYEGHMSNWANGCIVSENVFTGNINRQWVNPGNWSQGVVPQICHTMRIPNGKRVELDPNQVGTCHALIIELNGELEMFPTAEIQVLTTGM